MSIEVTRESGVRATISEPTLLSETDVDDAVGLIKKYNSRDLVFYNIQTIYFQIIFCVVLIISFYL